jgi:hypothetical protein
VVLWVVVVWVVVVVVLLVVVVVWVVVVVVWVEVVCVSQSIGIVVLQTEQSCPPFKTISPIPKIIVLSKNTYAVSFVHRKSILMGFTTPVRFPHGPISEE